MVTARAVAIVFNILALLAFVGMLSGTLDDGLLAISVLACTHVSALIALVWSAMKQ